MNSGSPSSQTPRLFVSLSGKPTPRPLSWRGWKTRPWIRLLSGTTLPPSTASLGVERWISSLPDSPVSHSVAPERDKERETTDGYGTTSPESSEKSGHQRSFWKMYEDCSSQNRSKPLDEFSGRWPTSGTMRNGDVSERVALEPLIGGNGCSSLAWQTMTTTDACGRDYTYPSVDHSKPFLTLTGQSKNFSLQAPTTEKPGPKSSQSGRTSRRLWTTPCKSEIGQRTKKYQQGGTPLTTQAGNWPTPKTPTGGPESTKQKAHRPDSGGGDLQAKVLDFSLQAPTTDQDGPKSSQSDRTSPRLWVTPRQENIKGSKQRLKQGSNESVQTQAQTLTGNKRLNPAFVEWLMGWPEQWSIAQTGSGSSGMELSRFRRLMRGALFGIES